MTEKKIYTVYPKNIRTHSLLHSLKAKKAVLWWPLLEVLENYECYEKNVLSIKIAQYKWDWVIGFLRLLISKHDEDKVVEFHNVEQKKQTQSSTYCMILGSKANKIILWY